MTQLKKYILMVVRTLPLLVANPAQLLYFRQWWYSVVNGKTCLELGSPWICLSAEKYLESILTDAMRVWEYGSGGSTVFFARRTGEVVSIEHNPIWYRSVAGKLSEIGVENCVVRLIEPTKATDGFLLDGDAADPELYISDDTNCRGMSFFDYVTSIDQYPDDHFDLVFVDGRSRPACIRHALQKVKVNGYLVLDNAERKYYHAAFADLHYPSWRSFRFFGLVHGLFGFSETRFWQRIV